MVAVENRLTLRAPFDSLPSDERRIQAVLAGVLSIGRGAGEVRSDYGAARRGSGEIDRA